MAEPMVDVPVILPPQLPYVAQQENPPAAQQDAEPQLQLQAQPVEVRWFYAVFLNILRSLWRPLRLMGVSIVLLGILCFTFQISLPVV